MLKGCVPFLPTWSLCTRVDVEQRARCPWLVASNDIHDSVGDVLADVRRHCSSQASCWQMSSAQDSFSSRAQVKPTILDPEDSPVTQPSPPTDDALPPVNTQKALGEELSEDQGNAPPALADTGMGLPSLPAEDALTTRSLPPVEKPSVQRSLLIRTSGSKMVQARSQILELSSSRFVKPNQDSQLNLLYGAEGRPPRPHKSMKLVIKHDRKRSWPSPAPVFESSTLYMTRRKNKYPNCQIQIQTARPESLVSKSSLSKWELQIKRAESNIRRSLSLECLGENEDEQPEQCGVQQNDDLGPTRVSDVGQEQPSRDFSGEAPQLYNGWHGHQNPKRLHTLLAAMEFGAAMASVRCDEALPQGEKCIRVGKNNILLQMGTRDRTTAAEGKTHSVKNFDRSCFDKSDTSTDTVLTLHCGGRQQQCIRKVTSSPVGRMAELD